MLPQSGLPEYTNPSSYAVPGLVGTVCEMNPFEPPASSNRRYRAPGSRSALPRGRRDDIDFARIDHPLGDVRGTRDVLHPAGGDVRALEAAVVDEVASRRGRRLVRGRRIRSHGRGPDRGRLRREQAAGDDRDDRPNGKGAPPAASWTGSMQPMGRRQPEFHVVPPLDARAPDPRQTDRPLRPAR